MEKIALIYTTDNTHIVVNRSDILYAEGCSNYCTLVTKNNRMLISKTLKAVCEFYSLTRTHKSFAVNLDNVVRLDLSDREMYFNEKQSVTFSKTFDFNEYFKFLT